MSNAEKQVITYFYSEAGNHTIQSVKLQQDLERSPKSTGIPTRQISLKCFLRLNWASNYPCYYFQIPSHHYNLWFKHFLLNERSCRDIKTKKGHKQDFGGISHTVVKQYKPKTDIVRLGRIFGCLKTILGSGSISSYLDTCLMFAYAESNHGNIV